MASVYAVTSGKGGSGKTAVACGLAAAFAEQGKRTVLVELDSGHRCCDYLFQLDEAVAFDLSDVQSGHCTLLTAVYSTGLEGLDLLAAPYRPEVLFSPEMLQGVCNELSLYYDCVVLDAPGHFWVVRALPRSVDMALLVCTPDPVCVRACHQLSVLLENLGMQDMKLVINSVPVSEKARRRMQVEDLDQVMDQVALPLGAVLPRCPEMEEFAGAGIPLPAKSTARRVFSALANRLQGKPVPLLLR